MNMTYSYLCINDQNFSKYVISFNDMGFLKKIKDTAEKGVEKGTDLGKKGIEKGTEVGTKAYDGTKDAAKKGHDKVKK